MLDDPRLRDERRFLLKVLPALLIVSALALFFLLRERKYSEPERTSSSAAGATPSASPTPPPFADIILPAQGPLPTPLPVPSLAPAVAAVPPPPPSPVSSASSSPIAPTPAPTVAPSSLLSQGLAALQQGEKAAARKLLLEAAGKEASNRGEAYNALGTIDYAEGKWKEAGASFAQAMAANGRNASYFYNHSEAMRGLGQPAEAVADLKNALAIDSGNRLYHNKLFIARIEAGDRDTVIQELRANLDLQLDTYLASCLGAAAAIEMQSGNPASAVGYLYELKGRTDPVTFKLIIADRVFQPYANQPEFAKILQSSLSSGAAPAASGSP